jgi:hypothetical protein
MFNGAVIEKPDDFTFYKKFVIEGAKFAVVTVEGKCGPPLIWQRFPRI